MKFDMIKGLTSNIYDVESLKNVFTVTFYDAVSTKVIQYEISERVNQLEELRNYLHSIRSTNRLIGYNNHNYDDVVITFIYDYLSEYNSSTNYLEITSRLKRVSDAIIKEDGDYRQRKFLNKLRKTCPFKTMDLAKLWFSKKLMVSLKSLQITMDYENVEEMVVDWEEDLETNRINSLLGYNKNDVLSTYFLLEKSIEIIEIRLHIEEEYGIECLSLDHVNTGVAILAHRYKEITGHEPEKYPHPTEILISDIILDKIKFETPIFNSVLEDVKKHVHVEPHTRKDKEYDDWEDDDFKFSRQFVHYGVLYSFGIGGIHSINKPGIIKPKKGWILMECDVASLYPNMILQNECIPRHLGEIFEQVFATILKERLEAKALKKTIDMYKLVDEALKFALNGITGNMGSKYSWAYDPAQVLKIRINGQLLLLMLVENLINIGCEIVSVNTDGINAMIPEDKLKEYYTVCSEWEEMAKLELEFNEYEKLVMRDVNCYLAVKQGFTELYKTDKSTALASKISTIGDFTEKLQIGKGMETPRIVARALVNYFVEGITIEETVESENDFKMFLMSQKISSKFKVRHGMDKNIQRINRYYASKKGAYLCKYENDPDDFKKVITYPVILANNFDTLLENAETIEDLNIDYGYYKNMCRKAIEQIDSMQLSLF